MDFKQHPNIIGLSSSDPVKTRCHTCDLVWNHEQLRPNTQQHITYKGNCLQIFFLILDRLILNYKLFGGGRWNKYTVSSPSINQKVTMYPVSTVHLRMHSPRVAFLMLGYRYCCWQQTRRRCLHMYKHL